MSTKGESITNFTLVCPECGDWEALYMDDVLVAEEHSLRVCDVLDAISMVLPNKFEQKWISDERAEEWFSENLNDML